MLPRTFLSIAWKGGAKREKPAQRRNERRLQLQSEPSLMRAKRLCRPAQRPLRSAFGKQFGLSGFGPLAGLFSFGAFTREPFPVQSHLLHQIEGLHGKAKLVLHNGQSASVALHGALSGLLVGRKERTIPAARVIIRTIHNLPARVLPDLAAVVPMKTKLGEFGSHLGRLLSIHLHPYPLSDYLGQFPKPRGFLLQQGQ
jgi:hypothetical protein